MARRSSSVSQAAITKLIKGALAAGIYKEHIIGVKLDREGAATLLFGEQKAVPVAAFEPSAAEPIATDNSWSDVDA